MNITLSTDIHQWWKLNRWINLSQLLEKELWRLRRMEAIHRGTSDLGVGTCPRCGNNKLKFVDGVNYKCSRCGHIV